MVDIAHLTQQLADKGKEYEHGFPYTVEELPGEVKVLKIVIEDREELPVFVSFTGEQILCICNLFKSSEVKPDALNEMHKMMLSANIPMPLSSFALIDEQYAIFGALSAQSSLADLVHEIEVLSSNGIEAIEAMREYLV